MGPIPWGKEHHSGVGCFLATGRRHVICLILLVWSNGSTMLETDSWVQILAHHLSARCLSKLLTCLCLSFLISEVGITLCQRLASFSPNPIPFLSGHRAAFPSISCSLVWPKMLAFRIGGQSDGWGLQIWPIAKLPRDSALSLLCLLDGYRGVCRGLRAPRAEPQTPRSGASKWLCQRPPAK